MSFLPVRVFGVAGLFLASLVACSSSSGGAATAEVEVFPELLVSPVSGESNSIVSIVGEGISGLPGADSVAFSGVPASVLAAVEGSLLVYVPFGATTGPITVTTPNRSWTSSYNFLVVPFVASAIPDRGAVGTTVILNGSGFSSIPEENQVNFAGATAPVLDASPTSIVTVVPSGAKTGKIAVSTLGGTGVTPQEFLFFTNPVIDSFDPKFASVGENVSIQGDGFSDILDQNHVEVGGVVANVVGASFQTLLVEIPFGALSGSIAVSSLGGSVQSSDTLFVLPSIDALLPAVGKPGDTIRILGAAFDPGVAKTLVQIDGIPADLSTVAYDTIDLKIPLGISQGTIEVTTPGGTAIEAGTLVVNPPTILSFSPNHGAVGSTVTIGGVNFAVDPALNAVRFQGKKAEILMSSQSELVVAVPADATSGKISVETPLGVAESAGAFAVDLFTNARFAYVANALDGTISHFLVDEARGFLRHNGYTLAGDSALAGPSELLEHPEHPFLFLANEGEDEIVMFRIEANGQLTRLDEKTAGDGPVSMAIDAEHERLFICTRNGAKLRAFSIDTKEGKLSPQGSPVATGAAPRSVAVHSMGHTVYVAESGTGTISRYSVDALGAMNLVGSVPSGINPGIASPRALKLDRTGTTLYAANFGENSVSAFAVAPNGALTPIPGSPYSVDASVDLLDPGDPPGAGPVSIFLDPAGVFLITANEGSDNITVFARLPGGALHTPAVALAALSKPSDLAMDPSGKSLFISHSGANQILRVSHTPNGIEKSITVARQGPSAISLPAPLGGLGKPNFTNQKLFTANRGSGDISVFGIGAQGNLSFQSTTPIPGSEPNAVVVSRNGSYVYVGSNNLGPVFGNEQQNRIYVLKSSPSGSGFDLVQTVLTAPLDGANVLALDPSGRFLFAGFDASASIAVYRINSEDGNLTLQQTVTIPGPPSSPVGRLMADPTGQFLQFVSTSPSPSVSLIFTYRIDPYTGNLISVPPDLFFPGFGRSNAGAYHPTGRFAFYNGLNAKSLYSFDVTPATGGLVHQLTGSPLALPALGGTLADPDFMLCDPLGRFLYLCLGQVEGGSGLTGIGAFTIDSGGTLAAVGGDPYFGKNIDTRALAIDPLGATLFSGEFSTGNIGIYSIDDATGALTPTHSEPSGGTNPQSLAISYAVE